MGQLLVSFCILSVLTTCCFNVYLLELITREAPKAGNIVTLAQFIFIFLEGFIFATNFCTKRRTVPLGDYLYLVITFFLVSVSNNMALSFIQSMPLHIIFKSGSLIANMLLGILLMNKKYDSTKYFSVSMITIGIIICTLANASYVNKSGNLNSQTSFSDWLTGILLLTFALIASARMGLFQESIHRQYGKNPREGLFYCHALPLPGFLVMYPDIIYHVKLFSSSANLNLLGLFTFPRLWVFLALNAITQYFCARSVFTLTTECSSLAVTLVLTLRKFLSLIISIYIFSNPFTLWHWLGTALVFTGTYIFVQPPKFLNFDQKIQMTNNDQILINNTDKKEN